MPSILRLTYHDYGKPQEASGFKVKGLTFTTGNIVAEMAAANALAAAIDAITLGVRTKTEYVADYAETAPTLPASQFAQREVKWLVKYSDDVSGELFSCEIPCADLALLDPNADERPDLTAGAMATFVTAFQTYVKNGANSVTVEDVVFVSRNL